MSDRDESDNATSRDESNAETQQECIECGTTERAKPRGHSISEIGKPGNPVLCPDCNREISR